MAIAVGNTIYWTSNGVTFSGVVLTTPTQNANGTVNQGGGEPFYTVNTVTAPGFTYAAKTVLSVRQAEARASV